METRKIRRDYRIYENYLKRAAAVRSPHENETAFVECAMHNEILRREQDAKRPAEPFR